MFELPQGLLVLEVSRSFGQAKIKKIDSNPTEVVATAVLRIDFS